MANKNLPDVPPDYHTVQIEPGSVTIIEPSDVLLGASPLDMARAAMAAASAAKAKLTAAVSKATSATPQAMAAALSAAKGVVASGPAKGMPKSMNILQVSDAVKTMARSRDRRAPLLVRQLAKKVGGQTVRGDALGAATSAAASVLKGLSQNGIGFKGTSPGKSKLKIVAKKKVTVRGDTDFLVGQLLKASDGDGGAPVAWIVDDSPKGKVRRHVATEAAFREVLGLKPKPAPVAWNDAWSKVRAIPRSQLEGIPRGPDLNSKTDMYAAQKAIARTGALSTYPDSTILTSGDGNWWLIDSGIRRLVVQPDAQELLRLPNPVWPDIGNAIRVEQGVIDATQRGPDALDYGDVGLLGQFFADVLAAAQKVDDQLPEGDPGDRTKGIPPTEQGAADAGWLIMQWDHAKGERTWQAPDGTTTIYKADPEPGNSAIDVFETGYPLPPGTTAIDPTKEQPITSPPPPRPSTEALPPQPTFAPPALPTGTLLPDINQPTGPVYDQPGYYEQRTYVQPQPTRYYEEPTYDEPIQYAPPVIPTGTRTILDAINALDGKDHDEEITLLVEAVQQIVEESADPDSITEDALPSMQDTIDFLREQGYEQAARDLSRESVSGVRESYRSVGKVRYPTRLPKKITFVGP